MWHPQNDSQPAYLTPPIKNISSGPSGVSYYEGTGSGPEWNDTFTLCDFRGSSSGSGLWKFKHKAKGAGFEIVDDQKFIWSVNATDGHWGPDGSFWVLDWFDGWEPVGKGRIYRFSDPRHSQSQLVRETQAFWQPASLSGPPANWPRGSCTPITGSDWAPNLSSPRVTTTSPCLKRPSPAKPSRLVCMAFGASGKSPAPSTTRVRRAPEWSHWNG